jgi:glutamyl-tRNA reductase
MAIIVVGLSHKTAPVEVREMLAVSPGRLRDALQRLCGCQAVKEGVILSTCNRVEVYAVVTDSETGYGQVQDFLADTHLSLTPDQLTPHLYWYEEDRAVHHVFRVAASLDSMIVGEPQILGQLKEAFETALSHKASGIILNKLLRKAISVAKRVRSETKIANTAVSVSSAAVELAKKIFFNLGDKTVLLLGAGEMAKLAARHLMNQGVQRIRITTRDSRNAVELAKQFNGVPVPFDEFRSALAEADIVLCSTGAPHYLVRPEDVQRAVRQRMNRPIFLIDISVPRNIDPAVKDIDNAFLFDIDDLETRVGENREERLREAAKAEHIVSVEIEGMMQWIKSLEVTPTIQALRQRAEEIKRTELDRALARLGALSGEEREIIEELAQGMANKFLHGSLVTLKSEAHTGSGPLFVEAARRFFNLEGTTGSRGSACGASGGETPAADPSMIGWQATGCAATESEAVRGDPGDET